MCECVCARVCVHLCARVCRTCSSALLQFVAFRNPVPVKESFVGSEYASVCVRVCVLFCDVDLRYGVLGSGSKKHLLVSKTTTRNVFTFDKNEKKKKKKEAVH